MWAFSCLFWLNAGKLGQLGAGALVLNVSMVLKVSMTDNCADNPKMTQSDTAAWERRYVIDYLRKVPWGPCRMPLLSMDEAEHRRICRPVTDLLDTHVQSSQPRSAGRKRLVHMVRQTRPGGLGDQLSGLLGSIALAVATGRRLEVSPQPFSYVHIGFQFPFDTNYTGDAGWLKTLSQPHKRAHARGRPLQFDYCLDVDVVPTLPGLKQARKSIHRTVHGKPLHMQRVQNGSGIEYFAVTSTHCQRDIAQRLAWAERNKTLSEQIEFFAAGL